MRPLHSAHLLCVLLAGYGYVFTTGHAQSTTDQAGQASQLHDAQVCGNERVERLQVRTPKVFVARTASTGNTGARQLTSTQALCGCRFMAVRIKASTAAPTV